MRKKNKIILAIILLAIAIAFFFPKETARGGGFTGAVTGQDCRCMGFAFDSVNGNMIGSYC